MYRQLLWSVPAGTVLQHFGYIFCIETSSSSIKNISAYWSCAKQSNTVKKLEQTEKQIKITNIIINTEYGVRFLLWLHKLITVRNFVPLKSDDQLQLTPLCCSTCQRKPAGGDSEAVGVQGYDVMTCIITLKVSSQRPLQECGSHIFGYFLNTIRVLKSFRLFWCLDEFERCFMFFLLTLMEAFPALWLARLIHLKVIIDHVKDKKTLQWTSMLMLSANDAENEAAGVSVESETVFFWCSCSETDVTPLKSSAAARGALIGGEQSDEFCSLFPST